MAKNVYIGSSLVYDVEYVETEKVHFVPKIPILDWKEKNKEICISDGKSGNAPKYRTQEK